MRPPDWAIRTKADEAALAAGCYWDKDKAEAIVMFAECVFRPQYIGGEFRLLEWQRRFLMSLYGWRAANGTRRFRTACLHIAKKNGKTVLVSVISAYELLKSEEPSAFVATGSVSKENTAQVFNELRHTVTQFGLKRFCKITPHQKRIKVEELNSEYRSLASDGDTAQGLIITSPLASSTRPMHTRTRAYTTPSAIAQSPALMVCSSSYRRPGMMSPGSIIPSTASPGAWPSTIP
jgi:phage terminase large subunit-like protein